MPTFMRCVSNHWQGDLLVEWGTVLPWNDAGVIPEYFESFQLEDPDPPDPV